jgi:glycosyltransferase involved in cell wall biosynthesis
MDKKYKIKSVCILNPFIFNKIKSNSLVKMKKIYSTNVLKIISVGRLTLQKDFMTLLKAIKLVKKRRIQLIIIGKGVEKNNLLKFIKNNKLNNSVKLIGYKKNPFKYIRQSYIFILTSIFEGSPNVLIEAQYLKKYIISTDCPTGPREILQNGKFGELVKMGDYKNIARKLENYSYNGVVKKKVIRGFNNIKNYDHKKNCMKYYNLINEYLI